ncbi:MAG: FMN-binding protein [Candidatus Omnitrophota bacterium]
MNKPRIIKISLLSVSIFLLIAFLAAKNVTVCVDGIEQKKQFTDGTYEGRSFKFPGQMKVSVIIKDGKIEAIKNITQLSLRRYTSMLWPLVDKIIEEQSTQVDAVSGATMSSNALKRAVDDALKKAAYTSP